MWVAAALRPAWAGASTPLPTGGRRRLAPTQPTSPTNLDVGKHPTSLNIRGPKRVSWSEVIKVFPDDETQSCVLRPYRDLGFTADSFDRERRARETLCEALIRYEDTDPKSTAVRAALKTVRRRPECELWP